MKRLVICCDGTWNRADQVTDGVACPTNVVKLALQVSAHDASGVPQLVYYDQGVGTGNLVDRLTGGAFGHGLEENLHAAYFFLVLNYEPGDEIFLFGFSRGAFMVRSLAGMIRKCGILDRRHADRYAEALALYGAGCTPDEEGPVNFRRAYSVMGTGRIAIHMIGVWDTVGSLGIPLRGFRFLTARKYRFHDVELSGTVQQACQALAIDEHRAPFEASRWAYKPKPGQVVEQVWFCGAHSDIGGGYPETGLSDIALEWMCQRASAAGLHLDPAQSAFEIRPDPLGKLHNSKTGLYRLTRGIDRVIGLAAQGDEQPGRKAVLDPTQSLHPSVLERWDRDPDYRPRNLLDYFRRIGDPRAEEDAEEDAEARQEPA